MSNEEYRRRVVFWDDYFGDWDFAIVTPEFMTDEQIERIIVEQIGKTAEKSDDYCPVDIMDDIVEAHPGWRWEDAESPVMILAEQWKGVSR